MEYIYIYIYIGTRHSHQGPRNCQVTVLRFAGLGLQDSDDLKIQGFWGLGVRGSWKSTRSSGTQNIGSRSPVTAQSVSTFL